MKAFWLVVAEILTFEKLANKSLTLGDMDRNTDTDVDDYNGSPCTSYRWTKIILYKPLDLVTNHTAPSYTSSHFSECNAKLHCTEKPIFKRLEIQQIYQEYAQDNA